MIFSRKSDIGVLIVPSCFGDWSCFDFVEVAHHDSNVAKRIKVLCHKAGYAKEFDADYGQFTNRSYVFHLFVLPSDIVPQQFKLQDIEYPFEIQGCVLSIDSERVGEIIEISERPNSRLDFDEGMKRSNWGGSAWINQYHLPFVVAQENSDVGLSYDLLQKRCIIPAGVPVVSSVAKFQDRDIQLALTTLIDAIT